MVELRNIILAFIGVLVGVALLGTIADNIFRTTGSFSEYNESVTLPRIHNGTGFTDRVNNTAGSNVTLEQIAGVGANSQISNIIMWMANGTSNVTTGDVVYVENTDYNLTGSSGIIKFELENSSTGNWPLVNDTNTTFVNYSYFDTDYVTNSNARTLITLVILFFVVGIILFTLSKLGIMDVLNKFKK